MSGLGTNQAVALEDFIQAVQLQLDTAQMRMSLKAENDKLPLTFAIRDIAMDLKAHVELSDGELRIRPAQPQDKDTTVLKIGFTAITRPMIEENAVQLAVDDADDMSLDALGDDLAPEERRRLEGIGVRTVAKLNELQKRGLAGSVGRITRLPVEKLESVLSRATRPMVDEVSGEADSSDELRQRLRVRGRNLLRDGVPPRVVIGGREVGVVQASDHAIVLEPGPDQFAGQMSLEYDPRARTEVWFDQSHIAPMGMMAQAPGLNGAGAPS
jgi:hypothetical protein